MNMSLYKRIKSLYIEQGRKINQKPVVKTIHFTNEQEDHNKYDNNPILNKLTDSCKLKARHSSEHLAKVEVEIINNDPKTFSANKFSSKSSAIKKGSAKTLNTMDTYSNSSTNRSNFDGSSNSPFSRIERTSIKLLDVVSNRSQCNPTVSPFRNKSTQKLSKENIISPRKKIPSSKKTNTVSTSLVNSNKNNGNSTLSISPMKRKNSNSLSDISGLLPKYSPSNPNKISKTKIEDFDLNNFINFDNLRSFANLKFSDIQINEEIYNADLCSVHKGKYLYLPVAIKVYNIKLLREEDLVNFI